MNRLSRARILEESAVLQSGLNRREADRVGTATQVRWDLYLRYRDGSIEQIVRASVVRQFLTDVFGGAAKKP